MTIYVCSKSSTFFNHVDNALSEGGVCQFSTMTLLPASEPGDVCIVHLSSFSDKEIHTFVRSDLLAPAVVALADDVPSLVNLLTASERGAKAYFNSYMAPQHYAQVIRLLEAGGSWFPPALLREVFALAKAGDAQLRDSAVELEKLTVRERELAEFVAEGRSNKEIALACNISERTVKSHLTSIYEKLGVKDRKGLMALLSYRPASA